MGLIDVLTQYDTKKKAAHAAKTVKHGVSSTREVEGCCQPLETLCWVQQISRPPYGYVRRSRNLQMKLVA